MKIGFIGLGIMGKPMVRNLLKAGHELVVFDVVKPNVDLMVEAGARAGESGAAIAAECPIIITMLPNSPHVKSVVCGENGILSAAKPGTILIDMSSIAPLASQEVAKACAEKGVRMLEAPVSGGEPKAIDGTMSIMCGGDEDLFNECLPILQCMGGDITYCGAALDNPHLSSWMYNNTPTKARVRFRKMTNRMIVDGSLLPPTDSRFAYKTNDEQLT